MSTHLARVKLDCHSKVFVNTGVSISWAQPKTTELVPEIWTLLETYVPRGKHSFHKRATISKVAENVEITRRCLRKLLLSQLLVFSLFSEHIRAVGINAERKKLWLFNSSFARRFSADEFHMFAAQGIFRYHQVRFSTKMVCIIQSCGRSSMVCMSNSPAAELHSSRWVQKYQTQASKIPAAWIATGGVHPLGHSTMRFYATNMSLVSCLHRMLKRRPGRLFWA